MARVSIGEGATQVILGNDLPSALIAGPCVIESLDHALKMGCALAEICAKLQMRCVYKSSFDKANRSSLASSRGPGLERGLEILAQVREKCGLPVITDIHLPEQAHIVAGYADFLQIPAFLCRQTDLILAAANTGKPVNIKKGQFVAPEDMAHVAEKARSTGNGQICLCERGTFFGYHNLVVDMRSLEIMKTAACPVIFDATHSAQLPGGARSGGERHFAFPLARAAVAIGVAALFMEVHDDPDNAPCDGSNMINLKDLPKMLRILKDLDAIAKAEQ